jgi:hypothetical protein
VTAAETLLFLTKLLTVQLLFAGLGLAVLRRQGYFADYIRGAKTSPGSYALVCPGVALNVMLMFWLNKGLVEAGLVAKFGVAYWSVSALAVALQVAMIALVLTLNRRHFGRRPSRRRSPPNKTLIKHERAASRPPFSVQAGYSGPQTRTASRRSAARSAASSRASAAPRSPRASRKARSQIRSTARTLHGRPPA